MSKWKKKVFYSLCILILLPIILFTTVDITPLKNQQYYKESKKIISEIKKIQPDSALVEAGWSEAHITPNFPVKVIGFGKKLAGLHDLGRERFENHVLIHLIHKINQFIVSGIKTFCELAGIF